MLDTKISTVTGQVRGEALVEGGAHEGGDEKW